MIWNCTLQKMCPDIKQFFSLSKFPLELSAPCSTSRSAFLSMEAKKKKCNCKQQHVCFSQPGFPLWNWGERKKKKKERNVFELLWALWCNARWFFKFFFPAYLPQIPCGLTCSDRFGKLAYQFAFALGIVFGLKINHLEEFVKPWCLLTMLLETVLIKSLYLYQALERLFVYLRQTDTHTHTLQVTT